MQLRTRLNSTEEALCFGIADWVRKPSLNTVQSPLPHPGLFLHWLKPRSDRSRIPADEEGSAPDRAFFVLEVPKPRAEIPCAVCLQRRFQHGGKLFVLVVAEVFQIEQQRIPQSRESTGTFCLELLTFVLPNFVDGSQSSTITVTVDDTASDDAYDSAANATISVTTTDNDVAGFTVTQTDSTTSVSESGTTDAFDVVLTVQSATDVVLTIVSGDAEEATVDNATLTFSSANWNTAQTVTGNRSRGGELNLASAIDNSGIRGPWSSAVAFTV